MELKCTHTHTHNTRFCAHTGVPPCPRETGLAFTLAFVVATMVLDPSCFWNIFPIFPALIIAVSPFTFARCLRLLLLLSWVSFLGSKGRRAKGQVGNCIWAPDNREQRQLGCGSRAHHSTSVLLLFWGTSWLTRELSLRLCGMEKKEFHSLGRCLLIARASHSKS